MDCGGFWIIMSTINSASNDTIFCFLPFISAFGQFWAFNSRTSLAVEGFYAEINGRKQILVSLEAEFFADQHIQNPLKSASGKKIYSQMYYFAFFMVEECTIHKLRLSIYLTHKTDIIFYTKESLTLKIYVQRKFGGK